MISNFKHTQAIGDDDEFLGVIEVSTDVHLLYCLIGSYMSWHRARDYIAVCYDEGKVL